MDDDARSAGRGRRSRPGRPMTAVDPEPLSGEPVVRVERHIKAHPSAVYAYLTDSAKWARWQGVSAEIEPVVGGTFRMVMATGQVATGRFIELVPGRRVRFSWGWDGNHPGPARLIDGRDRPGRGRGRDPTDIDAPGPAARGRSAPPSRLGALRPAAGARGRRGRPGCRSRALTSGVATASGRPRRPRRSGAPLPPRSRAAP